MPRVSEGYLEERRLEILDAAARCFAREGFHRTTMQDIVREAAASPGAIYRYFASKEDLIAAIASRRHGAELQRVREATGGADLRSDLRGLVRVFLGLLTAPAERAWRRVTIQLWGEALRNERVMEVVREGLAEPLRVLAARLRRARDEGRLPEGLDPDAAARLVVAAFQGLVLQQAWNPRLDVAACGQALEVLLDAALGAEPWAPRTSGTRRRARRGPARRG
jgi:AcrR family transcriptional regulator